MNKPTPTILILGAGYTLLRLARRLPPWSAVLTVRSETSLKALQSEEQWVERVDLSEPASLQVLFNRYPTITSVVDGVPPPKFEGTQGVPGNQHYPLSIAESLRRCERVIYLSTTGVFGVQDGSLVDELNPPNPQFPQAKARLYIENAYRSARCPLTVLRIPAIYGPGRGIGNSLRERRYSLIGKGENWSNRIHVEDLAEAIFLVLKLKKEELPPLLCITDDSPTQSKDVVAFYCSTFHLPEPPSLSIDEARQRGLFTMLGNQRISNQLMKKILSFSLRYPSYKLGAFTEFED